MIARTKSYVFTEILLAVFSWRPPVWPARLVFYIKSFQNKNRTARNNGFIGEYCGEYYLDKYLIIWKILFGLQCNDIANEHFFNAQKKVLQTFQFTRLNVEC